MWLHVMIFDFLFSSFKFSHELRDFIQVPPVHRIAFEIAIETIAANLISHWHHYALQKTLLWQVFIPHFHQHRFSSLKTKRSSYFPWNAILVQGVLHAMSTWRHWCLTDYGGHKVRRCYVWYDSGVSRCDYMECWGNLNLKRELLD